VSGDGGTEAVIFTETALAGVFLIEPQKLADERGFFARTLSQDEFAARGLAAHFVQSSLSVNPSRGTLRGLHYQCAPHEEAKVVSCVRGAIFDVVIDLRRDSPSYLRWFATELTAQNYRMVYVPEGCAHGFQTLEDDTVVFYQMSEFHHPESARGVRWDDPEFGIPWPLRPSLMSASDRSHAPFAAGVHRAR
jgi:dTDP-4-dehydrorhamnose 3,5-epimerase